MHFWILHETLFTLVSVLCQAIPGEGVLIIGQEQDEVGRNFSASEAFDGSISQFNMWDKVLSESEIVSQSSYRCNHIRGNISAWTDFYNKASDNVKKVTGLCAGILKKLLIADCDFFSKLEIIGKFIGRGLIFQSFFVFKHIYHNFLSGHPSLYNWLYNLHWVLNCMAVRSHFDRNSVLFT